MMLNMDIKLIASDIDGTLINDNEELPHNFEEMIKSLHDKDIHFAAISGRGSFSIKNKLKKDYDNLYIVSDNGAVILKGDQLINITSFSKEDYLELIEVFESYGFLVAAGTAYDTYVSLGDTEYNESLMHEFFSTYQIVDDLKDYADKDVVSISVRCPKDVVEILKDPSIQKLSLKHKLIQSGEFWLDALPLENNKGIALQKLSEHLGYSMDQTIAFGDYNNDIEMIDMAGYGFAMQDATDEVKEVADEVIGSNNDNSVINKIFEILR